MLKEAEEHFPPLSLSLPLQNFFFSILYLLFFSRDHLSRLMWTVRENVFVCVCVCDRVLVCMCVRAWVSVCACVCCLLALIYICKMRWGTLTYPLWLRQTLVYTSELLHKLHKRRRKGRREGEMVKHETTTKATKKGETASERRRRRRPYCRESSAHIKGENVIVGKRNIMGEKETRIS